MANAAKGSPKNWQSNIKKISEIFLNQNFKKQDGSIGTQIASTLIKRTALPQVFWENPQNPFVIPKNTAKIQTAR